MHCTQSCSPDDNTSGADSGYTGPDPEDTEETKDTTPPWIQSILDKYQDILAPKDMPMPFPPARNIDHKIEVKPGSEPPNRPVYRMGQEELTELKKQLTDLMDRKFIRQSTSPYGAPVLFAKKKDGTLRLCIDYRALNQVIGGEAVAVAQLEQAEMTADGVEGRVWFHGEAGGETGRNGAGLGPAFEMGFSVHGRAAAVSGSGSMWTRTSRTAGMTSRSLSFTW